MSDIMKKALKNSFIEIYLLWYITQEISEIKLPVSLSVLLINVTNSEKGGGRFSVFRLNESSSEWLYSMYSI